jgi:hypothetical protein
MGAAAPVGVTVTAWPRLRAGMAGTAAAALLLVLGVSPALAAERYVLLVTGASGGAPYAQKYDRWRVSLLTTLREKFKYPDDHLFVLAETESRGVRKATRENVQRVLGDLQKRLTKDDLLLVFLIGHGTSPDVDEAKFNLVGPDLTAGEWAELLKPIPGRLVFVDTTAASFAFMRKIASPGRVVLTATDSAAQQFETVLAEFLVKAFDDPAADLDKDGRVSVLEAFTYASAGVRKWYEERGELPTERPLLDDTGEGIGREAGNPGPDGPLARITYLEPEATPADAALAALLNHRAELEAELQVLKARRSSMSPAQYDAQLERILLDLVRVSQQIRTKS